jgi:hypothetical protein
MVGDMNWRARMSVAKDRMPVPYRIALILGLILSLHHACASAQAYPTTAVRVVVTGGAGTLIDSATRMVFRGSPKR